MTLDLNPSERQAAVTVLLDLDLAAVPEAVPELRRTVSRCLGVPCPDVQLCVSELVGNVIRHVGEGTPVRVRVSRRAERAERAERADQVGRVGRIVVEVTDSGPHAFPVVLHATADDETGRGLALLDAVALRWGVEQGAAGKTVWCECGYESRGGGEQRYGNQG
ncbi:ATP-binding protein [Streptomyces phyllanthi]|uniref:ATP-binding protein n=1 Tax=Streptomyces phyllanthi TaxID=1803180 RepID=A0A5N8WIL6_9ACTN|nr:ATP-binding protein [Streptomyces phyllanthi]MPY46354.1 ATP-binding protein [Streptomyces phyllanthi]